MKNKVFLSILFLTLFTQMYLVIAYDITRNARSGWYYYKWDNDWASTNFDSLNNRYRMKAWTWFGILDGKAKMRWDTRFSQPPSDFPVDATGPATLKIYWVFSGELKASGNGVLRFTYILYYRDGGQSWPISLSNSGIWEHTDNDRKFDNTEITHTFTTADLVDGRTYYVNCEIYLYQDTDHTSDFYDGSNGLELESVRLYN